MYRSVRIGEGNNARRVIAPGLSWFRRDVPDITGSNVITNSPKPSESNTVLTYNEVTGEILMVTSKPIRKAEEIRLDSYLSDVALQPYYMPDHRRFDAAKISTTPKLIQRHTYQRIIINRPGDPLKFETPGVFAHPGKIGIALLVSSKVNHAFDEVKFDIHLIKTLLASTFSSLKNPEYHKPYHLGVYLGFDSGDVYYDNEENIATLHAHILSIIPAGFPLSMYWVCTGDTGHAPARSWSILGNIAYRDG